MILRGISVAVTLSGALNRTTTWDKGNRIRSSRQRPGMPGDERYADGTYRGGTAHIEARHNLGASHGNHVRDQEWRETAECRRCEVMRYRNPYRAYRWRKQVAKQRGHWRLICGQREAENELTHQERRYTWIRYYELERRDHHDSRQDCCWAHHPKPPKPVR